MITVTEEAFPNIRRNSNVASILIMFLATAEVQLRETAFLGFKFSIERPEFIYLWIWIFWGYYLIRYYQFYRDYDFKDYRGRKHEFFKDHYSKEALKYLQQEDDVNAISFNLRSRQVTNGRLVVLVNEMGGGTHHLQISDNEKINRIKKISDFHFFFARPQYITIYSPIILSILTLIVVNLYDWKLIEFLK
ncbi:hypothetical protein AAOE16_17755 [Ekhidna sp. MALMAid0563]|uniref:hypothetical protein n=1 Tax=Ekhidna sp. MALMAid0563 TaxID=3143937 RepID=UPI0032DE8C50